MMTIFTCALFIPRANAAAANQVERYEIYSNVSEAKETKVCRPNVDMNVIKGVNNTGIYDTDLLGNLDLEHEIDEGYLNFTIHFVYGSQKFDITAEAGYDLGVFDGITYSLNGSPFYSIISTEGSCYVENNYERHFIDMFDNFSEVCHYTTVDVDTSNLVYCEGFDESVVTNMNLQENAMEFFRGSVVKYNTKYDGKECHLVTEKKNPRPINELLSGMKITDLSDGTISTYQIIRNEYNHTNCAIGAYNARILARDKAGNAVIQDVVINVVDAVGPKIICANIDISYSTPLSVEDIKEKINVTDEQGVKSIEIVCPEYLATPDQLNTYPYKVIAIDNYGNKSEASSTITVKDDVAPVLTCSNIVIDAPYTLLSEDEIKAKISAVDAKDGAITGDGLVITGYQTYVDNQKVLGDYIIGVTATDSKGNKSDGELIIHIVDKNYPIIEFESGVITITKGDELTKDLILNMLRQTGQIVDVESVSEIRSKFFNDEDPNGIYELEVELKDGTILRNVIKVIENENIKPDFDYTDPVSNESKTMTGLAIGTMVTLFSAALAGTIIMIIRKRH